MFTKIKEFLFGKPSTVEAPYKVEASAPKVDPLPAGIEAVVVTPNAVVPKAVVSTPNADKKTPKPRAPAKPRAKKAPAK